MNLADAFGQAEGEWLAYAQTTLCLKKTSVIPMGQNTGCWSLSICGEVVRPYPR